MRNKISLFLLTLGFVASAQQRDRFNVGLHYNPPIEDSNFSGGLDIRTRAVSVGAFNFGGGLSASYRSIDTGPVKDYIVTNPHIYIEAQPFKFDLKPYLSVGYAFYDAKYELNPTGYYPTGYDAETYRQNDYTVKFRGLTFAGGLRFDFARFLFADAGLKVYALDVKTNNPTYFHPKKETYAVIHLGLGVRF